MMLASSMVVDAVTIHGSAIDAAAIPPVSGAYVLDIRLDAEFLVALPGRPATVLAPSRYLYCGSARGPGGLRARVARHCRRGKRPHWHIDRLTEAGRITAVRVVPGGDECALVTTLATALATMAVPVPVPLPGFGSSDCTACASHLLAWPEGVPLPFSG